MRPPDMNKRDRLDRMHRALCDKGYTVAWHVHGQFPNFQLFGYTGGRHGVAILQWFHEDDGVEVYIPALRSNSMEDTIAAL